MKIRVEKQVYKGHPVLALYDEDLKDEYRGYAVLTLGIKKAKTILASLKYIEDFVKSEDINGRIDSSIKNI